MPVLPLPSAQSSIQRCVESLVEIRQRLACRQLGQQELLGVVDREHHALDEGQEIPPLGANDERHLDDGDALRDYLTGGLVWSLRSPLGHSILCCTRPLIVFRFPALHVAVLVLCILSYESIVIGRAHKHDWRGGNLFDIFGGN